MEFHFEGTCYVPEGDLADIMGLCDDGYKVAEAIEAVFMDVDNESYKYEVRQIYDQLVAEVQRRLNERTE